MKASRNPKREYIEADLQFCVAFDDEGTPYVYSAEVEEATLETPCKAYLVAKARVEIEMPKVQHVGVRLVRPPKARRKATKKKVA